MPSGYDDASASPLAIFGEGGALLLDVRGGDQRLLGRERVRQSLMLIEGQVKMHTLVIFFSILGGIAYFGILGMFFGPLVFAITIAFLQFYTSPPK